NGTTLEGVPRGEEPINHLYRNRDDGTLEDGTRKAGLAHSGAGQATIAAADDTDGNVGLVARTSGQNHHYATKADDRLRDAPAPATSGASPASTSTTPAGSPPTSPTTRTRARSTATTTPGPSRTSPSPPAAPTARTASRRRAWAWRSATTTATARWTCSRPTS